MDSLARNMSASPVCKCWTLITFRKVCPANLQLVLIHSKAAQIVDSENFFALVSIHSSIFWTGFKRDWDLLWQGELKCCGVASRTYICSSHTWMNLWILRETLLTSLEMTQMFHQKDETTFWKLTGSIPALIFCLFTTLGMNPLSHFFHVPDSSIKFIGVDPTSSYHSTD